jgi:ferredoxin--NADP+ reductase
MTAPPTAPAQPKADVIALPEVKMHLYRPTEPVLARVTKNVICTPRKAAGFCRHMEFDVSGTTLVGQVLPGQSIGVLAPGHDERGRPHAVRLYSVASPAAGEDGAGRIISTTVKRTIDEHWETHKLFLGVCSNYMADLKEGDPIHLSGPNGKRFLIPTRAAEHDYIFFATGTGIAPFRGMVLDLLRSGTPSRIVLVMGSPFATDLIYDDLFRQLAAEHPNFTYLTAISREKQDDGHPRLYVQDRLTTHRDLFAPLLASPRTLIYICGLAGMEIGIFQHLARTLPDAALEQYLQIDPSVRGTVDSWDRKLLHKQVKATRRVFLEVYA